MATQLIPCAAQRLPDLAETLKGRVSNTTLIIANDGGGDTTQSRKLRLGQLSRLTDAD